MKKKQSARWIYTVLLGMILSMTILGSVSSNSHAAGEKTGANTGMGTGAICNPLGARKDNGVSPDDPWKGSFVYYGKYNGTAMKYRVLDKATKGYDGVNLLLDCESILYFTPFDKDGKLNAGAAYLNEWDYSDVKKSVNGSDFLNKSGVFTAPEKNAITVSKTAWSFLGQVELFGDKIFLLDLADATNWKYGYHNTDGAMHVKKYNGVAKKWWLRTWNDFEYEYAYVIMEDGKRGRHECYVTDTNVGVSPAFNVNLNSILFSTVVSGNAGQYGAEYKLTILDNNLAISVPSGKTATISGRTVTVPYSVTGSDAAMATRASVLILDREYVAGSSDAVIKYYDRLNGSFSVNGTGTFTLPSELDPAKWGTDYHVYLVAEDVNGTNETDYACTPYELEVKNGGTQTKAPADIDGVATNLDGKVGVLFYVVLPDYVKSDAGAYATVTINGESTVLPVSSAAHSPKNGVDRVVFSQYVVSTKMNDKVTLKLFASNGEQIQMTRKGETVSEAGYSYSVMDYCQEAIAKSSNAKMVALAKQLKAYGEAAQIYFGYKSQGLSFDPSLNGVNGSDLAKFDAVTSGECPDGLVSSKPQSAVLILDEETTLRVNWKFEQGADPGAYQYFIDKKEATLKHVGNDYFLEVANISSKMLGDAHEFTISKNGKSYTWKGSALSWGYLAVTKGGTNAQNVGKALYLYYKAAADYFN